MRTAVLIAVVIAAVGGGASKGTAGSAPETELTISYWSQGRGTEPSERWTLRCNPAGGTVPRARAVCRQLYAIAKPFARRNPNLVCTDQYGGPQQAVIAGTHRGSRVWIALGMRNGCDISRAKRLAFLVPGFSANPNS
jgi:subtilisin inhibitor-like